MDMLSIDQNHFIDLNKPLDISIPLRGDNKNLRAWYVDPPRFEPVRTEKYVGAIAEGGSVNFRDVYFNPHGHGTHTECLGHITRDVYSVNDVLQKYFFTATLISILPKEEIMVIR